MSPSSKTSYLQAIMPTIMTVGRQKYSCRDIYHPGKTCSAYWVDKIIRCTLNCIKLTLISSLVPQIIKKRKQLFLSRDINVIMRTLKKILIRYIRAISFLVLGTSLPFITSCLFPLSSLELLKILPQDKRIMLVYASWAILSLIVELPTKMP